MKIKIAVTTLLCITALASCKKIETLKKRASLTNGAPVIPLGFTWQNSRNINFAVKVTDTRFSNSLHKISIYDGDPAAGGRLISKGAATNKIAFASRVFLSKQIFSVYILKTAPDNSTSVSKVEIASSDVSVSLAK